jgi:hypothetical protein
MKKSNNLIIGTLMVSAIAFAFSSCKFEEKKMDKDADLTDSSHSDHGHVHVYACPMHPEITGQEGEKCPKCGMALEHNDNAGNKSVYEMVLTTSVAKVEASKPADLVLVPHVKGEPNSQVPLDVSHDKKIHLIVVSEDLSYYDHIHPEYEADGSYKVSHSFPAGGNYLLFADYKPTGGNAQLEKMHLNVDGKAKTPVSYKAGKTTSSIGSYTVKLQPDDGKFVSGEALHISAVITKDGKEIPAQELENYLGAKAHVVVIGIDDKEFLHVHPEVNEGRLDLHTTFDKPGIYRAWLQFQKEGKVHTADFVIDVKQGTGTGTSSQGHQHSH